MNHKANNKFPNRNEIVQIIGNSTEPIDSVKPQNLQLLSYIFDLQSDRSMKPKADWAREVKTLESEKQCRCRTPCNRASCDQKLSLNRLNMQRTSPAGVLNGFCFLSRFLRSEWHEFLCSVSFFLFSDEYSLLGAIAMQLFLPPPISNSHKH